ncbi:MAG: hypothetical protein WAN82_02445 [Candidatus Bathyarchaeia archaeon]
MKPKRIMSVLFLLLLLALVGSVQANSVFVIEPSKEATQNVESNGCQSIGGNVSVVGGNIGLYVADPSGTTLLRYENISFRDFKVSTTQNGTYVIHLVNRCSTNNVTATLFYGRNFNLVLNAEIGMTWNTVTTWTTTVSVPSAPSNPWIGPLVQVALIVFGAIVCPLLVNVLSDEIRRRLQKWRDGEPKTPSTVLR